MSPQELLKTLQRIGIDGRLNSSGWINALCPYHDERNPSWGINTAKDHHPFSCFGCKATGTLYRLLIDVGSYSQEQARLIAARPSVEISAEKIRLETPQMGMWTIDPSELYPFTLIPKAANYLQRRGISPEVAQKAGVVYEPKMQRILFPWEFSAKLFGVTGRTINPNDPHKTLPLYGTKKGQMLYLPHGRFDKSSDSLILVEGEIDALSIYQAGYKNVGALGFGTITDQQVDFIQHLWSSVILFFDDDQAGEELTKLAIKKLSGRFNISSVDWKKLRFLLSQKKGNHDPGNMPSREIHMVLSQAKKFSDFPEI